VKADSIFILILSIFSNVIYCKCFWFSQSLHSKAKTNNSNPTCSRHMFILTISWSRWWYYWNLGVGLVIRLVSEMTVVCLHWLFYQQALCFQFHTYTSARIHGSIFKQCRCTKGIRIFPNSISSVNRWRLLFGLTTIYAAKIYRRMSYISLHFRNVLLFLNT